MTDFKIVPRPRGSSNVSDALIEALVKTEGDGSAIQLTLPANSDFTTWQANVRAKLKLTNNLRLRTKHNKVTRQVTCWSEKFADDRLAAGNLTSTDLGVTDDNDDETDDTNGEATQ